MNKGFQRVVIAAEVLWEVKDWVAPIAGTPSCPAIGGRKGARTGASSNCWITLAASFEGPPWSSSA